MTPTTPITRSQFKRLKWELRILLAIGFAVVLVAVVWGYVDSRNQRRDIRAAAIQAQQTANTAKQAAQVASRTAATTHTVLCGLKADYKQRLAQTQDFIRSHPDGIPGISVADLERSAMNLRLTIESYKALVCSG